MEPADQVAVGPVAPGEPEEVRQALSSVLHLFPSEQDGIEERRRQRQARARSQSRCGCCGRFHKRELLVFTAVCHACMEDTRPVIVHKVGQAKRWWLATKTA